MKFIVLDVKPAFVHHGYDAENKEIIETLVEEKFVTKIIALERIRSVTDKYLLVSGAQGREFYWEYKGNLAEVVEKFSGAGLLV